MSIIILISARPMSPIRPSRISVKWYLAREFDRVLTRLVSWRMLRVCHSAQKLTKAAMQTVNDDS